MKEINNFLIFTFIVNTINVRSTNSIHGDYLDSRFMLKIKLSFFIIHCLKNNI